MRPDYCPVANEPCQCVCMDGCRIKKNSRKPLTDEEITNLWSWSMTCEAERTASTQQHAFARAIEAALREKNA